MALAWHIAALSRQQRLPKLDTILMKAGKAAGSHQTPEQLLTMVRFLNAVSGGSVGSELKAKKHGR